METRTSRGRITGDQAHIIEELLGANRQLAKALEENLRLEGENTYPIISSRSLRPELGRGPERPTPPQKAKGPTPPLSWVTSLVG